MSGLGQPILKRNQWEQSMTKTKVKVTLLDVHQVAELVQVAPATIRRWVQNNEFPAPRKYGPKFQRWVEEDVLEFIHKGWKGDER